MAQRLKRLRIDRVAFVDQGANPKAHIALCKRKEGPMAEPTAAELAATVTKLEGDLAAQVAKTAEVEAKLAAATTTPEPEDVLKGLSPEAQAEVRRIRKEAEDLKAANAAQAERIEKIESDRTREQMLRKCATEFKALGGAEDLAGLLIPIGKALPKPEYDALLAKFKAWNEQIRTSALFTEIGKTGTDEAATPEEKLEALAKAYHKAHADEEGLTYEISYTRVLKTDEGKALYKALNAPQGGR